MKIIRNFIIIFLYLSINTLNANENSFNDWLIDFKKHALKTLSIMMQNELKKQFISVKLGLKVGPTKKK